jgi:hypothetical protein
MGRGRGGADTTAEGIELVGILAHFCSDFAQLSGAEHETEIANPAPSFDPIGLGMILGLAEQEHQFAHGLQGFVLLLAHHRIHRDSYEVSHCQPFSTAIVYGALFIAAAKRRRSKPILGKAVLLDAEHLIHSSLLCRGQGQIAHCEAE